MAQHRLEPGAGVRKVHFFSGLLKKGTLGEGF
jgi:hypothetical protein